MVNRKLKALIMRDFDTCVDFAQRIGIHNSEISAILHNRRSPSERARQAFLKVFTAEEIESVLSNEEPRT